MRLTIFKRSSKLHSSNQHLALRPLEVPREQRHQNPLDPAAEVLLRPRPDLLVVRVLRPLVKGPLYPALYDVDEARAFEVGLVLRRQGEWAARCLAGAAAELGDATERVVLC